MKIILKKYIYLRNNIQMGLLKIILKVSNLNIRFLKLSYFFFQNPGIPHASTSGVYFILFYFFIFYFLFAHVEIRMFDIMLGRIWGIQLKTEQENWKLGAWR